ncbi:serine/threonine-protein kinase [Streptomyces sp. NPDC086787]|uniref:serine/threonine-protein kinase n=1 Tax=Streptomyces sp. NPDC086787 TaxID=3365759 RepID=UPI003803A9E7
MQKLGPGDPQRIGAYRLLARLGAGGMGQVYLARSDRGRTVAVKLVRAELAAQEEFRARFRHEVLAARRVGGYWTAPVLDADTEAAVPWVATGYVAGPSLQQVVGRDHGPLPERSVRILAAGLAHALGDIHAAGIVHRDLKPSNVLLTIDGPRVIDFGIARAMETLTGDWLTRTGSMVGSPGFMSPEQVRGDRITPACDVFCLGSVLAYAATGKLPFGAAQSGVHALMFRIAQEEPDLAGVPEGVADLVRDCLRKDPATRPSLARILERSGAEDTVAGGRSRDPWLPGALVAALGRHAVRLLDSEDPEGTGPPHSQRQSPPSSPPPSSHHSSHQSPHQSSHHSSPSSSPEHAAAAEPPAPGAHPLPTLIAGRTPSHPAYGYPQQHPQPTPYNPYAGGQGPTPPPVPAADTLYGPPPEPARNGRSTALLVAVAAVVALAAGGSVYALMQGGGDTDDKGGGPARVSPAVTGDAGNPTPSPSPSASPSTSPPASGAVPTAFLGTWRTSLDSTGRIGGPSTRELTIRQGEVGDTVLTLLADGPTEDGGTYHCSFSAKLSAKPTAGGPLRIGPSTVTSGEPRSSCSPGEATEVTLLGDDKLRRSKTSGGGESLTYNRS